MFNGTESGSFSGADFTGATIEPGIPTDGDPTRSIGTGSPVSTPRHVARSSHEETAPMEPKPRRTAPPDALIPTMGFPAILYKTSCLFGHPEWVPSISKKESAFIAQRDEKRRRDMDRANKQAWLSAYFNSAGELVYDEEQGRLVKLTWDAQSIVVSVLTQKGGAGKTEDTVRLSRVFAKKIKPAAGPILVIPATRNPGSTTRKANVRVVDTLTIPEVYELLLSLEAEASAAAHREIGSEKLGFAYIDANRITDKLGKNEDGVYVIAQTRLPADFTAKKYAWVLSRLKRIFRVIIQDTGNNTAKQGEIEYMAAQMSDVLVFVCSTAMEDSPELMGETMDSYSILNRKDMLSAAITVINGLRPDDSLDNWVRFAEFKVNEQGNITGLRDFPYKVASRDGMRQTGTLMAIPWDDAIFRRQGEPIAQETEDAFLDLAVQIALTKGKLQNLDFDKLDRIHTVQKQVAEFDHTLLNDDYPTPQEWIAAHPQPGALPSA